jgi:membrane-bound ClpP family serine protease
MINTNEPVENFQKLYDDIKKYVELQTEYVKVEFVEKLTILLSTLLIIMLLLVLAIAALFYLFFSLAYLLVPVVGSLALSFAIISIIYVFLIILLFSFRKKLIVNPLARLLTKLFLNKFK